MTQSRRGEDTVRNCPPPNPGLSQGWVIDRIDSLAGMDSLRDAWQALEARAADPLAYFQSYDWCRNWCAHYAAGASKGGPLIRIYAGYLNGRLAALWPLMLTGCRPGVRKMVALTEPHTQYGNILVDPAIASTDEIADLIARCLRMFDEQERADAVEFDNVPHAALQNRLKFVDGLDARAVGLNSSMDLTRFAGSFEAYRAGLKACTRRARNKRRNRLAALGRLDYDVFFGGTPDYTRLVRIGIAMKREWLKRTGRATRALNLPHVAESLGSLGNTASGDHGAVAAALLLNGRPVAVEIGFSYHGRFYSYLGSFDWALRNYSPGKLQLEEALRWCITSGVQIYDLLGEPGVYKFDWCNEIEPLTTYRIANTIYGHAYLRGWRDHLRPALKQSFERMPLKLRLRIVPMIENRGEIAHEAASVG